MPSPPDDSTLDPEAARVLSKVRRLMAISVLFTGLAIAAVLMVVGYRMFKGEGTSAAVADISVALPAGARIVSTEMNDQRIAVTVEVAGGTELHLFDALTLEPRGRLKLTVGQ
jgi:hypothetical protein